MASPRLERFYEDVGQLAEDAAFSAAIGGAAALILLATPFRISLAFLRLLSQRRRG